MQNVQQPIGSLSQPNPLILSETKIKQEIPSPLMIPANQPHLMMSAQPPNHAPPAVAPPSRQPLASHMPHMPHPVVTPLREAKPSNGGGGGAGGGCDGGIYDATRDDRTIIDDIINAYDLTSIKISKPYTLVSYTFFSPFIY